MNYKLETKRTYNTFADDFESKFKIHAQQYLKKEMRKFLELLSPKSKILDIGSGPGDHALLFQNQGHEITCIDLSEEMIKKCKENGLNAQLMDFENLEFPENSFDGIWACTSLLHIPKENLGKILKQISQIMKPQGIFFLGMKQGNGECFNIQDRYPGTKRWFSLYTNEELRKYLEPHFKIKFYFGTTINGKQTFLNYLLTKKII